jgi:restriction endonuclease S subunit
MPLIVLLFIFSPFYNHYFNFREITGATVTGLTKDVVNSLKIPLPPIEKQNQIAKRISKIRDQAKQLQTEAKNGLEQAKHEVEIMILKG